VRHSECTRTNTEAGGPGRGSFTNRHVLASITDVLAIRRSPGKVPKALGNLGFRRGTGQTDSVSQPVDDSISNASAAAAVPARRSWQLGEARHTIHPRSWISADHPGWIEARESREENSTAASVWPARLARAFRAAAEDVARTAQILGLACGDGLAHLDRAVPDLSAGVCGAGPFSRSASKR